MPLSNCFAPIPDSVSLDEIDYVNIILLVQFVKNSDSTFIYCILFSLVTLQIAK